jgi:hypothetical protein
MQRFSALLVFIFISAHANAIEWKGIFIAGDNSIENFDNGRVDLTAAFSAKGDLVSTTQLSSSQRYIGHDGVVAADAAGVVNAFKNLNRQEGQGCLVHMTSHGTKAQGFYLALAGILSPKKLAQLVNEACGDAPAVILISACYSGQFITPELKGPNRVILTAARADRPSFGCSSDTRYTYWDDCVLTELPQAASWQDLYAKVGVCIQKKEADLQAFPSEPQAFFGENTSNWEILH